ncbi:MAG: aminoacyl-tRNA hydrolase, partial [Acidimicrobiales bacterium]
MVGRVRRERSGTPYDLLVVGLGNPGSEYARTRHNVGADVVDLLGRRHDIRLKADSKVSSLAGDGRVDGRRLALAFPTTYMNDSGLAVSQLVRRYGIEDLSGLLIVHDELDLPQGRIKLKVGGGLAGHNGLRSIASHLKSPDFLRIRIGVGKPPGGPERGADWVLGRVATRDRAELDVAIA